MNFSSIFLTFLGVSFGFQALACSPAKQGAALADVQEALEEFQENIDTDSLFLQATKTSDIDRNSLKTNTENFTIINLTARSGSEAGDCSALNMSLVVDFYIRNLDSDEVCLFDTQIELKRLNGAQSQTHSSPVNKGCF